jgi:hypothetical protein
MALGQVLASERAEPGRRRLEVAAEPTRIEPIRDQEHVVPLGADVQVGDGPRGGVEQERVEHLAVLHVELERASGADDLRDARPRQKQRRHVFTLTERDRSADAVHLAADQARPVSAGLRLELRCRHASGLHG